MRQDMVAPHSKLTELLEAHKLTRGIVIRAHGQDLILTREEPFGPDGELVQDDRLRLTRVTAKTFGLSVRRHTGRWQKTPFSGTLEEIVDVIKSTMQHLIAQWT